MKNFVFYPHKLADRIVIGAVILFIVVLILLGVMLLRYTQLQQIVSINNAELRDNVEELQETTEDLQAAIDQLQSESSDENLTSGDVAAIDQQLSELGEQLETMEQVMEQVAPLFNEELTEEALAAEVPSDLDTKEIESLQNELRWLFTMAAWLVGTGSVVTAVIAYFVLNPRVRKKNRRFSLGVSAENAHKGDLI